MKELITSYFSFTKRERNGIITLLIIIVLLIILPFFYSFFIQEKPIDSSTFEKEIATLQIKNATPVTKSAQKTFTNNEYYTNNYYSHETTSPATFSRQMFTFDPNTLSDEGWKKLGIKDKTIQTIQKYLSKGGKFYKPEDIAKIWGLRPEEIERLQPYIQIQQKENEGFVNNIASTQYQKNTYTPTIIDINNADTTALIALPGIGSKLAQRIIVFRNKLGGFYKIEQVKETFGLPDSVYQKIKSRLTLNNTAVQQININTATLDELKTHPYIRYNIANAIVQYRNQHGNFNTTEDCKKIMLIDEKTYNKIAPYLKSIIN